MITISINNQEVIFLPFDREFPTQIGKGQHVYLVINFPFQIYMEVTIKKCGESSLGLAYTFDSQDFGKDEFEHEE